MARKFSSIFLKSLLPILLLVVIGCSSSSQVKVSKALNNPIQKGKTVVLSIKPDANVREKVDSNTIRRYIDSIRVGLFGQLPSGGFFEKVVNDGGSGDYTLEIILTGMRKVGGVARVLFGFMAGPNFLRGDVALKENISGNVMTNFEVTAKSASIAFSGEGAPEDASREFVKEIIKTFRSQN